MKTSQALQGAARCWERAGFPAEAAERYARCDDGWSAGRCLSLAGRHPEAALAYSRAGAWLHAAREHLLAGRPEQAAAIYARLPAQSSPPAQVELLLGRGEIAAALELALTSGDRETRTTFAKIAAARGRPDLAARVLGNTAPAPWNRSLRQTAKEPEEEPGPPTWPTRDFTRVALVPVWEEEVEGYFWGDRALAWSDDGTFFAAALRSAGIARGRLGPGGVQLERFVVPSRAYCVCFLPGRHDLLAGLRGGEVRLLRQDGSHESLADLHMPNNVWSITFAPGGDRLAIAAQTYPGAVAKVWARQGEAAGNEIAVLREEQGNCVPLVAFSPGAGNALAFSPGPDGTNRLQIGPEPPFEAHDGWITSLSFTIDGRFLITGAVDQTMAVRDGRTGRGLGTPQRFEGEVYGAAAHPRAPLLAVGERRRLHLFRLHPYEGMRLEKLSEQNLVVRSLAFSPDGRHLLVLALPPRLHLFRVELDP